VEKREYFTQVIDITIANGTAAGIQSSNQRFNSQFDKLEGISLIEKGDGGNASEYEVGFEFPTDNRTARVVNNALFKFDAGCPMSDRALKMNATAKGAEFTVNTNLLAAASAELSYQLVLHLSRKSQEIC